ncbi:hypothetical protein Tco_1398999 [Tanacetum coccineum]
MIIRLSNAHGLNLVMEPWPRLTSCKDTNQNKLSDDHKALQQVHLGCVRKDVDLTEKLVAVEKERDNLLDKN